MSQVVGTLQGQDSVKNNILRPPSLLIPAAANTSYRNINSDYGQQSVQLIDDFGNGAAHVRIAQGGYRTTMRVIHVALNGDAKHKICLPNNVGGGTLSFSRIDGVTPPTGFLKILDDRGQTDPFIISPGMSMGVSANMHRLVIQGSGCDADSYAVIIYAMETYMANITFNEVPSVGDVISFGSFANFEAYDDIASVATNNIGVERHATVSGFCDNLVTAFNTAYIAAIEPAGTQSPYHWATKLDADDLVIYKHMLATPVWESAADAGVQFDSVNLAMIRSISTSMAIPDAQITKIL